MHAHYQPYKLDYSACILSREIGIFPSIHLRTHVTMKMELSKNRDFSDLTYFFSCDIKKTEFYISRDVYPLSNLK
ncbi:hypothetical protein DAI22_01g158100 [Oryza sativa Japonica Group]|nr:hypothetical protein DAI22_01g158100 [Oryza sativa Japonica Group]